jgi:hypothetical protein
MIQTIGRVNANGTFNNISVISPVAVGLIGGGNRYSQREKKTDLKVTLHQFWVKNIFPENSIRNTAVPLLSLHVSSRNMFN